MTAPSSIKSTLLGVLAATTLLTTASQAVTTITFGFDTPGDTEGWGSNSGQTGTDGPQVEGFNAALGIDGMTGVATATNVSNDPQVTRGPMNTIVLPTGETWSSVNIRFRQLTDNPGAVGVAGAPYDQGGTILFFNGSTQNLGVGPVATRTATGAGAFAGDTYALTLTPEATGEWQNFTVNLSAAPTLNSQDFTGVRFDPVGNDVAKNFEIDSIEFQSVPEPSHAALVLLGAGALLFRRRR